MVRRRLRRGLAGAFLAVTVIMTAAGAGAATQATQASSDGITISPPLREVVIGPGLLQTSPVITVKNQSGRDFKATIRTVDFEAVGESGGITLQDTGNSKYGLARWMTLPKGKTLSLKHGESTDIPVQIDNRGNLSPGGHYGAVVIAADNATGGDGNVVSLKQELVSLLFVKKLGGEKYGLRLESLKADKGRVPQSATLRFASTGNVHVVPRGYVEVTDPKGVVVAKGIINPESTLVLPDKSRQFITLLQPVNPGGGGRYKLTAYYRYDGENQFASQSVYLSAWTPSAWMVVIIILTGVICTLLLRRIHQKRQKSAKNS